MSLLLQESSVLGHVSCEKPRHGRSAMPQSAHATTYPVVKEQGDVWRCLHPPSMLRLKSPHVC